MEVIIASDQDIVAQKCADIIESQITTLPDSVLGLATGSTPVGLYKELINKMRSITRTILAIACMSTTALSGDGAVKKDVNAKGAVNQPEVYYYRGVKAEKIRTLKCDVAVYGGTPTGVSAAIQAARMGKKVILLSFNQHVGGLTSGGLTSSDLGKKESIGGLSLEFYTRLGKKSNFSSSKAESVFRKMLDEAGVQVLLVRPLEAAEMKDKRITSIRLMTGET